MALTYTVGTPSGLGRALGERRKRQKRMMHASLMLTPMVDMFSLLVIFLLQFFNASPDFQLSKGIILPPSLSAAEQKDAPVVSVTEDEVFVEHKKIGNLDDVLKNPEAFGEALATTRDGWVKAHSVEEFKGEIDFEAHEAVDSTKVSQLMAVMSAQQYGSIQLMTLGN